MSDWKWEDAKLNCAGEFMSACEGNYQLSQAVGALSRLLDGGATCEFIENFSEALQFAVGEAKRSDEEGDPDARLDLILEFCHAYLAKAYEKKAGRA
jgi:hypothetical protein